MNPQIQISILHIANIKATIECFELQDGVGSSLHCILICGLNHYRLFINIP